MSLWPPCPRACALGMGRAQIRGGLQHLALVALLGARSPSPALHDELWRSWGWAVLKGPWEVQMTAEVQLPTPQVFAPASGLLWSSWRS